MELGLTCESRMALRLKLFVFLLFFLKKKPKKIKQNPSMSVKSCQSEVGLRSEKSLINSLNSNLLTFYSVFLLL